MDDRRQFRYFLVQVIMGRVGAKHSMNLDHRYKVLKNRYKGAIVEQRIRVEKKALITQVRPT